MFIDQRIDFRDEVNSEIFHEPIAFKPGGQYSEKRKNYLLKSLN